MTKKELIDMLEQYDENVTIYIEADHGQLPEQASRLSVTKDEELTYYGDDMHWYPSEDVKKHDHVSGVCIGY